MNEHSLPGIKTYELNVMPDERGFFVEILRKDWESFIDEWIVQSNLSFSYPGIVRAWHRHAKGQTDYFVVLKGAMKICAYDDRKDSPTRGHLVEIIASEDKLQVIKIPGHYWHGTKTIGHTPSLTVYFVSRLYNYKQPDEERRPWNDSSVVPIAINGKTNDPRVNKPWDWFYAPNK